MEILFISSLSSKSRIDKIHSISGKNPGFAIQRFNRLLVEGLSQNDDNVKILSALPITRSFTKKLIWRFEKESEYGIQYNYLPFVNFPIIKQASLFFTTLFFVLKWCVGNKHNKRIVCDVLNSTICAAALMAGKIMGVQTLGIVTDVPGVLVLGETGAKIPLKSRLSDGLRKRYVSSFDKFVFLTQAMNDIVNKHNKPYVIVEGICDAEMGHLQRKKKNDDKMIFMYAGGLFARYGIETLIKAFSALDDKKCELHLYGDGPFVKELKSVYLPNHENIKYYGVHKNSDVILAELEADILVNPRPSIEEFTKYSFPSKNIEYMSTGTPLLTTKLPGMPQEYYQYVLLMEDESADGYRRSLEKVLTMANEELWALGEKAKSFVIYKKNSTAQGKKVLELLS